MATDAETTAYLKEKWEHLAKTTDVENSVQDKWWEFLKTCYSNPIRKYHTFLHLRRMFDEMEKVADEIKNKGAVSYAIFFHDTGYDIHSQDNEEKSLSLFSEFCLEASSEKVSNMSSLVEQLIVASKSYSVEEPKSEEKFGKDDVHYFMDFDISILGSEADEYKKYTEQIREEYCFLPKPKYNFMRAKVLQQFLLIPNIYATELFRMKYEKQARSNIQCEIDSISK